MKSKELREKFLKYFESKGHTRVASSSLNQTDDPTLLFPNAGMNQFKGCFLGTDKRSYLRAATSQKCMRISGKHNDFENVGVTARHHTFFEMLGNFSFGDYFKSDAITFAWEFVTKELGLDEDRLWVTIFKDDDEAHDLWVKNTAVPSARIVRLGEKDNFWAMGDTGPCGPCSEIHYVLLDDPKKATAKGLENDDGSFIEIWNLVFMQFNRDQSGTLNPLPKPSVDTGMGLERISAVVNGFRATYDTDLLRGVISECEKLSGHKYDGSSYEVRNIKEDLNYARDVAMRVIADHSRAIAFLIADGVHPSSDGRGYVLRRILRRAVRHGRTLNFTEPFLKSTTAAVVRMLGDVYPELKAQEKTITTVADAEEVRFYETLDSGLALLQREVENLGSKKILAGEVAFQLYDTYGFPLDLTEDALKAHQITVDIAKYDQCLNEQRERSRSEKKFKTPKALPSDVLDQPTKFVGYQQSRIDAKLIYLEADSVKLKSGEEAQLIFDFTPFYAESGGQVGDTGYIKSGEGLFRVEDTQKLPSGHFMHIGVVEEGELSLTQKGDLFHLEIDTNRRKTIALNHSATHLVHSALRKVLGKHVKQAGSRVDNNTLRFDYSHFEALSDEQLKMIEEFANEQVRINSEVLISEMSQEQAKAKNATALFGEKYGEVVRVVEIGSESIELCGGTHVTRSGDIGMISILSEGGISSGVRRIECLSGYNAEQQLRRLKMERQTIVSLLKGDSSNIIERLEKLLERQRELEKEIEKSSLQLARQAGNDLVERAIQYPAGFRAIAEVVESADIETLKTMVDSLRVRLGSGIVALGATNGGKSSLVIGVTADLSSRFHAGNIIKEVLKNTAGRGGGRADFAQAGGIEVHELSKVISCTTDIIASLA